MEAESDRRPPALSSSFEIAVGRNSAELMSAPTRSRTTGNWAAVRPSPEVLDEALESEAPTTARGTPPRGGASAAKPSPPIARTLPSVQSDDTSVMIRATMKILEIVTKAPARCSMVVRTPSGDLYPQIQIDAGRMHVPLSAPGTVWVDAEFTEWWAPQQGGRSSAEGISPADIVSALRLPDGRRRIAALYLRAIWQLVRTMTRQDVLELRKGSLLDAAIGDATVLPMHELLVALAGNAGYDASTDPRATTMSSMADWYLEFALHGPVDGQLIATRARGISEWTLDEFRSAHAWASHELQRELAGDGAPTLQIMMAGDGMWMLLRTAGHMHLCGARTAAMGRLLSKVTQP